MAGQAVKKSRTRRQTALLMYGGILLAVNVVYFGLQLGWWGASLTRGVWTGLLFLAGLYVLSMYNILQAADMNTKPEFALDLFGLAVSVQLGSLYSPKAWYLLWLILAFVLYTFGRPLLGFIQLQREQAAAEAGFTATEKDSDSVLEAKRQRREDHRRKLVARAQQQQRGR